MVFHGFDECVGYQLDEIFQNLQVKDYAQWKRAYGFTKS
jgi:hypothetical protein